MTDSNEEGKFVEIDGAKFQEDPDNEGEALLDDDEKPIPFEEADDEAAKKAAEEKAEAEAKAEKDGKKPDKKKAEEAFKKRQESKDDEGDKEPTLSSRDVLALAKADIHDDDMDEVIDFAAYKKVDVKTALKDKSLIAILATRVEERATADATNTRGGARAVKKSGGEEMLKKAEEGKEVPEDSAGMDKLAEARMARKKAAKKAASEK